MNEQHCDFDGDTDMDMGDFALLGECMADPIPLSLQAAKRVRTRTSTATAIPTSVISGFLLNSSVGRGKLEDRAAVPRTNLGLKALI